MTSRIPFVGGNWKMNLMKREKKGQASQGRKDRQTTTAATR
jgi:triosephosphate isomerase